MFFSPYHRPHDTNIFKYLVSLLPGLFALLVLVDYYKIFPTDIVGNLSVEQKMIYLCYVLIAASVIGFFYVIGTSSRHHMRW